MKEIKKLIFSGNKDDNILGLVKLAQLIRTNGIESLNPEKYPQYKTLSYIPELKLPDRFYRQVVGVLFNDFLLNYGSHHIIYAPKMKVSRAHYHWGKKEEDIIKWD